MPKIMSKKIKCDQFANVIERASNNHLNLLQSAKYTVSTLFLLLEFYKYTTYVMFQYYYKLDSLNNSIVVALSSKRKTAKLVAHKNV
jgi:hypothetical protein